MLHTRQLALELSKTSAMLLPFPALTRHIRISYQIIENPKPSSGARSLTSKKPPYLERWSISLQIPCLELLSLLAPLRTLYP